MFMLPVFNFLTFPDSTEHFYFSDIPQFLRFEVTLLWNRKIVRVYMDEQSGLPMRWHPLKI